MVFPRALDRHKQKFTVAQLNGVGVDTYYPASDAPWETVNYLLITSLCKNPWDGICWDSGLNAFLSKIYIDSSLSIEDFDDQIIYEDDED